MEGEGKGRPREPDPGPPPRDRSDKPKRGTALEDRVAHADIWFDGACLGNPGPMGAGAVVQMAGTTETLSVPLGPGTNNVAEYEAVIAGLALALRLGATSATLRGDSQLILRQLEGRYAVKAPALVPLHAEARKLMARLGRVGFHWIPREENARADALAKQAAETRPVRRRHAGHDQTL